MKKIIALLLALVMVLSLSAVAFAAEAEEAGETEQTESSTAGKLVTLADGTQWPTQPITVYVGYSAGGNVDIMTRFLVEPLSSSSVSPSWWRTSPAAAAGWPGNRSFE